MLLLSLTSPCPDQPAFKQAKLTSHWQRHAIRFLHTHLHHSLTPRQEGMPNLPALPRLGSVSARPEEKSLMLERHAAFPQTKTHVVQFSTSLTHPYPKAWPCHPPLHSCKHSSCFFEICDTWSTHQVSWVTGQWLLQLIQQITEKSRGAFPWIWSFFLITFFLD